MIFLLVRMTPLGGPVDPLVYMMQNTSSSVGFGPRSSGLDGLDLPNSRSALKVKQRPPRFSRMDWICLIAAWRD